MSLSGRIFYLVIRIIGIGFRLSIYLIYYCVVDDFLASILYYCYFKNKIGALWQQDHLKNGYAF